MSVSTQTQSLWQAGAELPRRKPLCNEIEADAVVIGAGLAGVLTAYRLRQKGLDTVVIEARRVGSGQTGRTTAKITSQHGAVYAGFIKAFGRERARQYAAANERAIAYYEQLIDELDLSCEFERCASYLYSAQDRQTLMEEAQAAVELGINARYVERLDLPVPGASAVRFDGQAQFHPLRFLAGVAQKLTIYEQTRAVGIEPGRVICENGSVRARHIIMTAHFPFLNTPGYYFMRMHQERSYILALEGAPLPAGMYYGIDPGALSLRTSGPLLLVGGQGHRTGEAGEDNRYELLRNEALRLFPQASEAAAWSAQDCMPIDGVPYIGRFSSATPDLYVATGFQKWGMTTAMAASRLLTDAVTGVENPYAEVFSPQRFVLGASAVPLMQDGAQTAKGLAAQLFEGARERADELKRGCGELVEYQGEKLGAFRDADGVLHTVNTRCPHLGCRLAFNPAEQSWDCPCHGSRFDYTGRLLDGPAMQDLESGSH